jgi:hypothetical protein
VVPLEGLHAGPSAQFVISRLTALPPGGSEAVELGAGPVSPLVRGAVLSIEGFARAPSGAGLPLDALARLDGARVAYRAALGPAGFRFDIPSAGLRPGPHRIAFALVASRRRRCFPAVLRVNFVLADPAPARPLVLGDHRTLVGFLEHVTTLERASAASNETGPVSLLSSRTLFLNGWLVDVAHGKPLRSLEVDVDGRPRVAAHLGEVRPELRDYFGSVAPLVAAYGGFSALVPLANLRPGAHRFGLVATDSAGRPSLLPGGFPFTVMDGKRIPRAIEPPPVRLPAAFGRADRFAGSVDELPAPRVARPELLVMRGWAVDLLHRRPLAPIVVTVDGEARYVARSGLVRPRVALRSGASPPPAGAGWNVAIPTGTLAAGLHLASVSARDPATGRPIALATGIAFTVR